jgi:TolB protein
MACTANPPASNLRGLVAYSTEDGAIWVMHADGSNRRQVTTTRHPAYDFDPSLSPDGRRVVFRTSRGRYAPDPNGTGVQGIFVIDVDGSHEHQIQPPRGGLFPDWSPDGRRIAFSTLRANGTETIVTTDPDGSHRRQLTRSPGRDYPGVWSPDGRQLAFGSQRHGSFDVYVMDADGSDQRRLTDTGDEQSPVAWLPDGQIVFSSFHGDQPLPDWFLMNRDGTGTRSLPQLQGAGDPIDWLAPGR